MGQSPLPNTETPKPKISALMVNFCIGDLSGRKVQLATEVERQPGWLDVVRQ